MYIQLRVLVWLNGRSRRVQLYANEQWIEVNDFYPNINVLFRHNLVRNETKRKRDTGLFGCGHFFSSFFFWSLKSYCVQHASVCARTFSCLGCGIYLGDRTPEYFFFYWYALIRACINNFYTIHTCTIYIHFTHNIHFPPVYFFFFNKSS